MINSKGRITLGTEFLGRGTDVQPMESVEKAGGVKVILGFIPQSNRNKL